jgi:hypothetical protein
MLVCSLIFYQDLKHQKALYNIVTTLMGSHPPMKEKKVREYVDGFHILM